MGPLWTLWPQGECECTGICQRHDFAVLPTGAAGSGEGGSGELTEAGTAFHVQVDSYCIACASHVHSMCTACALHVHSHVHLHVLDLRIAKAGQSSTYPSATDTASNARIGPSQKKKLQGKKFRREALKTFSESVGPTAVRRNWGVHGGGSPPG